MQVSESHLESFSSWLCFHEDDIIGYPGMCFHSPLARWLSEVTGHTYGVDGSVYGRGSHVSGSHRGRGLSSHDRR